MVGERKGGRRKEWREGGHGIGIRGRRNIGSGEGRRKERRRSWKNKKREGDTGSGYSHVQIVMMRGREEETK